MHRILSCNPEHNSLKVSWIRKKKAKHKKKNYASFRHSVWKKKIFIKHESLSFFLLFFLSFIFLVSLSIRGLGVGKGLATEQLRRRITTVEKAGGLLPPQHFLFLFWSIPASHSTKAQVRYFNYFCRCKERYTLMEYASKGWQLSNIFPFSQDMFQLILCKIPLEMLK